MAVALEGAGDLQLGEISVEEPIDLVRLCINERITIKLRHERELIGTLHAFDQHLNMILGNVTETITRFEIDPETYEEMPREDKRNFDMLFVRGDSVILIAPPTR